MKNFDDSMYLYLNPDVAEAVARGVFPNGLKHYEEFGKAEGRKWRSDELEPLFAIDGCSVYRGIVIVDGWARSGPPKIFYQGRSMSTNHERVRRPDILVHHGPGSDMWGFRTWAFLTMENVEHAEIELRFPDGGQVCSPGSVGVMPAEDMHFKAVLDRFCEATRSGGRLVEIGSRARSGNTYRNLFSPLIEYVGLDIAAGPNVDIVGDAHHLSRFVPGQVDFVFSISVFEHLLMPWMVAIEMNRVLKLGGLAYIQSHPTYPLHDEPWDFWRFSKDGWVGLFNTHTGFEILDRTYAARCLAVPDFARGGHWQGLDAAPSYLLSACLIRKIGDSTVRWDAEAGDIVDLGYKH